MENNENNGSFNLYATIDPLKIAAIFGCIIIFIGYMCARWSLLTGKEIPVLLLLYIVILLFNLYKTSERIFATLVLVMVYRLFDLYQKYASVQKSVDYYLATSNYNTRHSELARYSSGHLGYYKIGIEWATILLGIVIVCLTIYMRRNKITFAMLQNKLNGYWVERERKAREREAAERVESERKTQEEAKFIRHPCPHCGTLNRILRSALIESDKCGSCGKLLTKSKDKEDPVWQEELHPINKKIHKSQNNNSDKVNSCLKVCRNRPVIICAIITILALAASGYYYFSKLSQYDDPWLVGSRSIMSFSYGSDGSDGNDGNDGKYDDPGLVASRSIMCFSDGKYDEARQYWTDECRSANNAIKYYLDELTEKQKLVKVEVINQKIDDKIAIINVRLHTRDVCGYDRLNEPKYTTEKTLVATKEGTKWKLSLIDPDFVPITIAGISQETLNNSSYVLYDESMTLKNGEYSNIHDRCYASINNVVYGDINRDNQKDAFILLSYSGGGSGIFYYVIPIISKNGKIYQLKPTLLGDRIDIKSIKIISNALVVNMITQGPDDAACCPTQKVKNVYKIRCNGIYKTN